MTSLYNQNAYGTGLYGGLGVLPTTYSECLDFIENTPYASTKLRYIALLPSLRGDDNPLYEKGLQLIKKETDENVVASLKKEIYTFVRELTPEENNVFNYIEDGYVADNPGIVGNSFSSYVGVYINQQGEYSGVYP